jgi:hypothetical protein
MVESAALLLATVVSAWPAMAQTTSADLTFTLKTTSMSSKGRTITTERFLMSGTRVRMEVATDPPNAAAGGMYSVANSADTSQMAVMPQLRMVTIGPLVSFATLGPDFGKMAVTDVTKDIIEDLGPGEPLLGLETRHYRISRAGTLTTTRAGRSCPEKVDGVEDMWIATDEAARAEMRSAERRTDAMFGMSRSDGDSWMEVFDAAAKNRPPRGLILRSERRSNRVGVNAKPDTVAFYTTEYTELSSAPIDSMLFAVPAGFRVRDARGLPGMDAALAMVRASLDVDSLSACRGG